MGKFCGVKTSRSNPNFPHGDRANCSSVNQEGPHSENFFFSARFFFLLCDQLPIAFFFSVERLSTLLILEIVVPSHKRVIFVTIKKKNATNWSGSWLRSSGDLDVPGDELRVESFVSDNFHYRVEDSISLLIEFFLG